MGTRSTASGSEDYVKKSKILKRIINLNVQWFCRLCWQHGVAAVAITRIKTNYPLPTQEELLKIVSFCHNRCKTPDLRLHYDTKEIAAD